MANFCPECGVTFDSDTEGRLERVALEVIQNCPLCSEGTLNGAAIRCGNPDHHMLVDAIRNTHVDPDKYNP